MSGAPEISPESQNDAGRPNLDGPAAVALADIAQRARRKQATLKHRVCIVRQNRT